MQDNYRKGKIPRAFRFQKHVAKDLHAGDSTAGLGDDIPKEKRDDEEDDNKINLEKHMGSLFGPRPPFIQHDFSLCDGCYRTSKQFGYLSIGGQVWRQNIVC